MAVNQIKVAVLNPSKAQNIPIAPVEYSQKYQEELNNTYRLYFNQIDNFTQAASVPSAGPTSDRPVKNILAGYTYFDTTLKLPIWWDGSGWINASGTSV